VQRASDDARAGKSSPRVQGAKRAEILDAAAERFARDGYEGTGSLLLKQHLAPRSRDPFRSGSCPSATELPDWGSLRIHSCRAEQMGIIGAGGVPGSLRPGSLRWAELNSLYHPSSVKQSLARNRLTHIPSASTYVLRRHVLPSSAGTAAGRACRPPPVLHSRRSSTVRVSSEATAADTSFDHGPCLDFRGWLPGRRRNERSKRTSEESREG
jgi:hypothetical protein